MPILVRIDDLSSLDVQGLISEHLAGMHSHTPAGHVNALAIEALKAPSVTFWSAWSGASVCGCGAMMELSSVSGEVKSMRTREAYLKQGVAQAVLTEIFKTATQRNYTRLYLETGTGPSFEAAHSLYRKNGFDWCGAFGNYTATEFNVFMVKHLRSTSDA